MHSIVRYGRATGIGSLPYTDVVSALDLVFRTFPEMPHWPQLPRRGAQEGIVDQFMTALLSCGLLIKEGKRVRFATHLPDWPQKLTEFYSVALAAENGDQHALAYFATPRSAALGFHCFCAELDRRGTSGIYCLKGQLAGPLTTAVNLQDDKGRPAYYDEQLRDLVVRTLSLSARWQALALSEYNLPVMIFIDDPGVNIYGQSAFITVTRDMIKQDLTMIIDAIKVTGAYAGLHSCDAIDWSILFELPLDVVSLDSFNFMSSLLPFVQPLKEYLDKGGVMAWGAVPTFGDNVPGGDACTLLARLESGCAGLEKHGLKKELLLRQALITPACGTGLLTPDQAEEIYRLTRTISQRPYA